MAQSKGSAIRELLSVTAQPEMISFAGGIPAPEAFPLEAAAVATEKVFREQGRAALQYGPTEGYGRLRDQIAAMYRERGVLVNAENILLISGAQQGLDLVGRLFLDKGDNVVIEEPTYVGALQAWSPFGPHFTSVSADDAGLQVEGLELIKTFKLLYLIPNFQNPTGATLSLERRRQLLTVLRERQGFVVEDDPYRRLRYSGEDIPGLFELEGQALGSAWNTQGRIIQLGTFSKTLAPGLRVGWVVAPTPVIRAMVLIKQGLDLHTSSLTQRIVSELIADGTLESNLPSLCSLYRQRRDAMLGALETHLSAGASWTHPDGGLFVWCVLRGDIDTAQLLAECLKQNVAYVPGNAFYPDQRRSNALRLNFSCMAPDRIRDGVARLATVIETMTIASA
jgi:2-aminoadipate transaminase